MVFILNWSCKKSNHECGPVAKHTCNASKSIAEKIWCNGQLHSLSKLTLPKQLWHSLIAVTKATMHCNQYDHLLIFTEVLRRPKFPMVWTLVQCVRLPWHQHIGIWKTGRSIGIWISVVERFVVPVVEGFPKKSFFFFKAHEGFTTSVLVQQLFTVCW